MLTLSPPRGVDSAFSCLPKGFNNLLMNLWALDYLGNWNLMLSVVHPKEEFWPTRTFPTSAPPSSSIILLSGSSRKYPWWGYSSPRFLCPSKKSMLTFSPSWAPNFWAPFLVQNSEVFCPMRTLATSVPFSSSIGHIVTFFLAKRLERTELHISSRDKFFNTSPKENVLREVDQWAEWVISAQRSTSHTTFSFGEKKWPKQAHVPFKPARAGAAAEGFCLDVLQHYYVRHMLGTGLGERNMFVIVTHIRCKVLCLLLHHVQKVLAFILAHFCKGMLAQCCLKTHPSQSQPTLDCRKNCTSICRSVWIILFRNLQILNSWKRAMLGRDCLLKLPFFLDPVTVVTHRDEMFFQICGVQNRCDIPLYWQV